MVNFTFTKTQLHSPLLNAEGHMLLVPAVSYSCVFNPFGSYKFCCLTKPRNTKMYTELMPYSCYDYALYIYSHILRIHVWSETMINISQRLKVILKQTVLHWKFAFFFCLWIEPDWGEHRCSTNITFGQSGHCWPCRGLSKVLVTASLI